MRRIAVCLAAVGTLALAPPAVADENPPMCPLVFVGPYEYQGLFGILLAVPDAPSGPGYPIGRGEAAVREAVGNQYTALWFDGRWQGWGVAIADGPLDAQAARAAILSRLATRLSAEQVAFLDQRLRVYPALYSEAELKAVMNAIAPLAPISGTVSYGISCALSDQWRVEFTRYVGDHDPTPEEIAETETLLAPFGDKVRVQARRGMITPVALPAAPVQPQPAIETPMRVADYVTLPRSSRCVRGKRIGVRAAKHADLRSVTIAAGKRRATAAPGRRASLRLRARSTTVTVTVTLRDGRSAAKALTYRRCESRAASPRARS